MGQALLLGLLFMYSWMVLGLVTLRPQHSTDLCSNMVDLFEQHRQNKAREIMQKTFRNNLQNLEKTKKRVRERERELY